MGTITISLVVSSLKSKETTFSPLLQNSNYMQNSHLCQIKDDYDKK